ncbi:hypothetical protein ACHAQE_005137 [Botrytis cinerea]
MAERMLIMHGGQPENFQMAVAKVFDLIESHFGKQESLLQNCKCLVLASPIQYLKSGFSYEPKDVTFVQLFNLKFEKKEGELTYDHLWRVNLRTDLEEREPDIHQRECDATVREIPIVELEESTRTTRITGLKCRFLDAVSLEESIAIRNEALRELEEKLDDRKQLAMVDKKTLREECARVSRHIVKIKIHEDMVKGAEALPISRERAHKKFRDEFQVREALIKEREAAIDPRKDNARQNHFAKFSPTGLLCKAQQFVKAEQAKLNSGMMVRELPVLEREQKMAALEAALKLEREMIRTRFRETEEMKQRADASQAEVKNQRTALYIEEKKK